MSYYYILPFIKARQENITQATKNEEFKFPNLLVVQRLNYQGCFIFKQLRLGWLDNWVRKVGLSSHSCGFNFCKNQLNWYKETCFINPNFKFKHTANYPANICGYSQEVYTLTLEWQYTTHQPLQRYTLGSVFSSSVVHAYSRDRLPWSNLSC